jgi:hypothetical protein
MKRFMNWLTSKFSSKQADDAGPALTQTGAHLRHTGSHRVSKRPVPAQALPRRQPEFVDLEPGIHGRIEDNGPGKNVLIRNKFVREDTGTHETLMILDDSSISVDEEDGIDPYNTGQFDRSRNWDRHLK